MKRLLKRRVVGGGPDEVHAAGDNASRIGNDYVLDCIENGWKHGLGLNLAHFQCKSPPMPLKKTERRYFKMIFCSRLKVDRLRACVEDTETGQRRYEVPSVVVVVVVVSR